MIPNEHSFCDIDPDVVDRFGIPVLRFHFRWSDHELKTGEAHARYVHSHYRDDGRNGAGYLESGARGDGISVGGTIIHELGTIRMGNDTRSRR